MTTLILALVLAQDPILAEAMKGYQAPWVGFREGSKVTYRETLKRPAIDEKGNLVYQPVTNEVTWTVATVEAAKVHLKIVGGGQEAVIPIATEAPSWARGVAAKKGTEEVQVSGRPVQGQVYELGLDLDKDAGQKTTIVKSEAIPYWALRRRVETLLQGKVNTSEEERVLQVEEKVKVGDRELSCTVVEVTTEAVGGLKTVTKEWRSDQVPGRLARREVRRFQGGQEQPSAWSEMDVVSWDLKR